MAEDSSLPPWRVDRRSGLIHTQALPHTQKICAVRKKCSFRFGMGCVCGVCVCGVWGSIFRKAAFFRVTFPKAAKRDYNTVKITCIFSLRLLWEKSPGKRLLSERFPVWGKDFKDRIIDKISILYRKKRINDSWRVNRRRLVTIIDPKLIML